MPNGNGPELPTPAPDVPPLNEFDVHAFTEQVVAALREQGVPGAEAGAIARETADAIVEVLALLTKYSGEILRAILVALTTTIQPLLNELVRTVGVILGPGMTALSQLTSVYVNQFVEEQRGITPGADGPHPDGLRPAAAGLFDAILAPLGFLVGGAPPAEAGAGEKNAQYVLGSITAIHLSSWMVNIISNLTGLGALKFINSFDDVITAAISARGLSRMAMKPYVAKFIGTPLERDLNVRLPLASGSVAGLLKRYIRGNITNDELRAMLRGLGYDDAVVEDLLLDTAKLLLPDAAVYAVNEGIWTEDQALENLTMSGWPDGLARITYVMEKNALVKAQMRSLANSLVSAFEDRRLDNETLRYLLAQIGFTPDEIEAFSLRGATLQEIPRRLTRADVRQLYQESLVDLSYVERFLREEGYSEEDTDLLVLLEFTRKEDREAQAAALKDRARQREEARLARERAALAAQQTESLRLS